MSKATPSPIAFELTWHVGDAAGYTDLLPVDFFAQEVESIQSVHDVRGPKGGVALAIFELQVGPLAARLDYAGAEFRAMNERNGMVPGVMVLKFPDPSRQSTPSVWWDGQFQDSSAVTVRRVPLATEVPAGAGSKLIDYAVRPIRPAQHPFRALLMRVYGAACCISGCKVTPALDAAHIEAFGSNLKLADCATNGLLLRADLHALFDRYLLSIDPKSNVVHVAPSATFWPEYARLDRAAALAQPASGFEWAAPDRALLQSHWARFSALSRRTPK